MIEKTTEGSGLRIDHAEILRAISVPASIEFVGEHGLDLVAVMQRGAGVGHDDFADLEAFEDFGVGVGHQADPHLARLDGVAFDHLHGQMVDGGARNGDAAAALGVDGGAGEHADLERRIVGQRDADMAELGGAVDLRRNQPDAADQIGRVVAADPHRRARIELQHVDARHFGVELDLVVDGDAEHRAGLRRGRRADDGPDLGDEARRRRAQRDRSAAAALLLLLPGLLRRRAQPGQFLIVGDGVALADEEIGDLGAFLVGADHGLAARHDEAGDAHQVGEAGIGGFRHDDQRLARRVLFLGLRPVLEPVVRRLPSSDEERPAPSAGLRYSEEHHRRINPNLALRGTAARSRSVRACRRPRASRRMAGRICAAERYPIPRNTG